MCPHVILFVSIQSILHIVCGCMCMFLLKDRLFDDDTGKDIGREVFCDLR